MGLYVLLDLRIFLKFCGVYYDVLYNNDKKRKV